MAASDGALVIDTRLDDSGLKAGLRKLKGAAAGALTGILLTTLRVGTALQSVIKKITDLGRTVAGVLKKLLLGGLLVFGASVAAMFRGLRETFDNLFKNNLAGTKIAAGVDEIKNKFTELKFSIALAFLPLIEFAIPYIKMALDWLIQLVNKVAMITAAFLGQKQVLQVIPGSAAKLAKETEKTKKAAQGALAAFDQINVLQKPDSGADVPTSDLPQVATQLVPITDDILAKVQAIKNEIAEWFADPIGKLKELWGLVVDWFRENVFDPIAKKWKEVWSEKVLTAIGTAIFKAFSFIGTLIQNAFTFIGNTILAIFTNIGTAINNVFIFIGTLIQNTFTAIGTAIFTVFKFIGTVINTAFITIGSAIQSAFTFVANIIKGAFGGVYNYIVDIINGVISLIGGLIQRAIDAVNAIAGLLNFSFLPSFTPAPAPATGGTGSRQARRTPRLASGAVIPPNAEFAAILGDQKSGRNLEAPEALIRQIIREEMGGGSDEVTVPLVLMLDGETVYKNQQRVGKRRGRNLVSGGTT
jgi:phage-related protein